MRRGVRVRRERENTQRERQADNDRDRVNIMRKRWVGRGGRGTERYHKKTEGRV